jgi:hypothetical protein
VLSRSHLSVVTPLQSLLRRHVPLYIADIILWTKQIYHLACIVAHIGANITSGHFIALVPTEEGATAYDDNILKHFGSTAEALSMLSANTYSLMYECNPITQLAALYKQGQIRRPAKRSFIDLYRRGQRAAAGRRGRTK